MGSLICFALPFPIRMFLPLLGGLPLRVWTLFISLPSWIMNILTPVLLLYQ
ncbi:hypothetical protein [Prochlorococcus marinus]|uniref:hypothetical protein n=1 Tax=Prochlorococcus marinus TaxID=1219 RepID=UPI001C59B03A